MPKKICIHCQERPGTTRDHVFPFAWYPSTTPTTIQRRTVPSCLPCNQRLHEAEDAIGLDLLFICSPLLPDIAGVQENIFRSWKPDHARGDEDPKHRTGRQLKILRTMEWVQSHPGAPLVYVQKGGGAYRPASPARSLDKAAMRAVVEKFIRGLHYLEVKLKLAGPEADAPDASPLLPLDTRVEYSIIPNDLIRVVDPLLTVDSFGPEVIDTITSTPIFTLFGPGFHYRRLRTAEGPAMWLFRLWGQLDIVALAFPSAFAAQVEKAAGLSPRFREMVRPATDRTNAIERPGSPSGASETICYTLSPLTVDKLPLNQPTAEEKKHWTAYIPVAISVLSLAAAVTLGIFGISLQRDVARLNRAQAQADLPIRLAIHPRGRGNNARSIELRNFGSIDAMNVQLRFLVFAYSVACRRSMGWEATASETTPWKVIPRIPAFDVAPVQAPVWPDKTDKAATCRTASDGRVFINLQPNAPGKSACTKQEPCTHALVLYADATHPKTFSVTRFEQYLKIETDGSLSFPAAGFRATREVPTGFVEWRNEQDKILFTALAQELKGQTMFDVFGYGHADEHEVPFYGFGLWRATGVEPP